MESSLETSAKEIIGKFDSQKRERLRDSAKSVFNESYYKVVEERSKPLENTYTISQKARLQMTLECMNLFGKMRNYSLNLIESKIIEGLLQGNPSREIYKNVGDEAFELGMKLTNFFTFPRYFDVRRHNLSKDPVEFITEWAKNEDAYEFLEAITWKNQ